MVESFESFGQPVDRRPERTLNLTFSNASTAVGLGKIIELEKGGNIVVFYDFTIVCSDAINLPGNRNRII